MTRIETTTEWNVPIEAAFNADRDISLHAATQKHRQERPVAGVMKGLIQLGEEVEWEAVHFGVRQRLRVRITAMRQPDYFKDEMLSGAFKSMAHEHIFQELGPNRTRKTDIFVFAAPLGILGIVAEKLFLASYMKKFLEQKNLETKRLVEAGHSALPE